MQNNADALAQRQPEHVEGVMSIHQIAEAWHALAKHYEGGDIIRDFMRMVLDAAHQNGGQVVKLNVEVL